MTEERAPAAPAFPRLMVFTDTTVVAADVMVDRIEALLGQARARSVLVVLRDRDLSARLRLALGRRLRDACTAQDQIFGVADRLDLAVLLGADAAHLGEGSVDVEDARRVLPRGTWISRACHDPLRVAGSGADAVLLSPIVAARKGRPALGVGALADARRVLTAAGQGAPRLYALGGVDGDSATPCLGAGADGVAVIGAALDGREALPLLAALGIRRESTAPR